MPAPKLFVSHADDDKVLAKAFVRLLESGIGVPAHEIFCASQKGQGIRPGKEFKDSIRSNLDGATTVVALLSENFYNSAFCMCELGGVWLDSKDLIPVLVPPATYDDMKAVLKGLQALRLDRKEDLDELRDEIKDRLALEKPHGTPRWNGETDAFLAQLGALVTGLPKPPIVPREKHEKLESKLSEYETELAAVRLQLQEEKGLVEELKKTKDASEVKQVLFRNMPEWDRFGELVEAAREALEKLDSTTKEALFADQNDEEYVPQDWEDAKRATDYKEVQLNPEENALRPNRQKTVVNDASNALESLQEWLTSGKPSGRFFQRYASEHGDAPDLSDRAFWDKHLW